MKPVKESAILALIGVSLWSASTSLRAQPSGDTADQAVLSTVWITYDHTDSKTGAVTGENGTGFIVDVSGHILTAYHVVEKWMQQLPAEQGKHPIFARIGSINSPTPIRLEMVSYDATADIAILKLRHPNTYTPVKLCFISELKRDSPLYAYGFPHGRELASFPGTMSNSDGPGGRWSANINFVEGTSGGPVFNSSGQVVGIIKGGLSDVTAVRYITPVIRSRSMLADIGVTDTCATQPPPPVRRAALRVAAEPDTVGIHPGTYQAVDYRFSESKGVDVQVETEDSQFKLPNGEVIGSPVIGGRILGGSFQVDASSQNIYHNNIYLPPDIARAAKDRGQNTVHLHHVFYCRDVYGNLVKIPSVLRIVIL